MRFGVDGGDGRLKRVSARRAQAQRTLDEGETLGDLLTIPERSVLLLEKHDLSAVVGARITPRIMEQHEGEESGRLGLVGHETTRQTGEPDGLAAEVTALQGVARR